nr:pikachurin-like [Halyomorpha halys]
MPRDRSFVECAQDFIDTSASDVEAQMEVEDPGWTRMEYHQPRNMPNPLRRREQRDGRRERNSNTEHRRSQVRPRNNGQQEDRKCHGCGKTGHLVAQCPRTRCFECGTEGQEQYPYMYWWREQNVSEPMSSEPLSLGEWHEVTISRTGRLAVLQVDKNPSAQILSPGAFTQLYLPLNIYIGGIPNFDMVSPKVKVRTSFVGCIQKILINNRPLQILAEALAGVNVDNCPHPCVAKPCGDVAHCVPHFDFYKCVCDKHCEENSQLMIPPVASFTGNTHLHYTDPEILNRILSNKVGINMRLRTTSPSGLILWTGRSDLSQASSDYLALGVKDGYLHMRYNLGSGETFIVFNDTKIDDGMWHRVKATRNEQEGSLTIDHGETVTSKSPGKLKQLNTNTGLYVGGIEEMEKSTHYKYHKGFSGCVSELTLNSDYHIKLTWSAETADHCGDMPP